MVCTKKDMDFDITETSSELGVIGFRSSTTAILPAPLEDPVFGPIIVHIDPPSKEN